MTTARGVSSSLASAPRTVLLSCMAHLLILGCVAALATPAEASTANKATEVSKPTGLTQATSATEARPRPNDEVIALRAQLDVMRQYDQRLLSTVYWSLAVVVTLVIALTAIIGLFNLRVYEHDKAALRQDVLGFLNQEFGKSQQTFRQEIAAFQQGIQKALEESRGSIAQVSRETAESVAVQLRGQLAGLDHDVTRMQFDLAEMEANDWKSKGVYANGLRANLKMLDIAGKLNYDFLIAATLEDMQLSLKAIVAKNFKLVDAKLAKSIAEALDGLPNTYAIETGIISDLLQKARS